MDDGSPDRSGEICDEYANRDKRIRVIHQANQGVSAARNAGLAAATGDWIGFVDGDDWIDPEMYEYLHKLAETYHSRLVQVGIYCEQRQTVIYNPSDVQHVVLSRIKNKNNFWRFFANSCCCRLFQRDKIKRVFFNPTYPLGEDVLFNLEVLSLCGETVLGNKAFYHYRQNRDSSSHMAVYDDRLISVRKMFQFAEEKFFTQRDIAVFCRNSKLRNNLDICSKIVCNHLGKSQHTLVEEIRNEMKGLCKNHFKGTDFAMKEKVKSYFIGYAWNVYQYVLPKWKTIVGKSAF